MNSKNEQLLLYSNIDTKLLSLCLTCFNYPSISITQLNKKVIHIKCYYCGYDKEESLHNYLEKIKRIEPRPIINKCLRHNQIFINYCVQCKVHLCGSCDMNVHQGHQLQSLLQLIKTNDIINKIKESYDFLNNYCVKLKNEMISSLSSQINQIEYSFEQFSSTNIDILLLIQSFINTYQQENYNYYTMNNLNKHKDIHIYKFNESNTEKNDNKSIIHYFNNKNIYYFITLSYLYVSLYLE